MKINAAYSSSYERALENGSEEAAAKEAGFATLESTIEEYIGIPIHYHAMVDFQAFQQGVDAVGGIDVQVDEPLYDPFISKNKNGLIAAAGLQRFDGFTALQYSQSRYTSSDFARGERQRQVIIALKNKVLATGTFSNPKTVSDLLDALGDNVTINATLGEIMRMYEITKDIPSDGIANVGLTDEPNVLVITDNVNDQSIVRPRAGINDYSEIQSFVRNTLRDPFLKSENATIAVLNGTSTPGLATIKANELKSYGYNVTIIDDAPTKDYQNTVVYDKSGQTKKYTRNYLENRLGAKVTEEPTSSNPILVTADFIVVLGQNETTSSTN
jgi:LCP family protein required for cell wall assembly